MTSPRKTRRKSESGYALLFIFAMAAIVAIGLYEQLPRAAFEAQREKEQLLINHGEQYKRGVQLYVRKMGRYPANMSDLDNTQSIRFLRKHYFDPMTGKEEWRLLHMGPGGKLIDSKIETNDPNKDQWHAGSITEFKSVGSSDTGGTENANIATRKRPSDEQFQQGVQGGTMSGGSVPDPTLLSSNPSASNPAASNLPGSGAPSVGASGATGPVDPNAPPQPGAVPGYLNGGALPGMPSGQRGVTAPTNVTEKNGAASLANANSGSSSVSGNGGFGSSISGNGGFGAPQPAAPGTPSGGAPGFGNAVNSQFGGQSPINANTGFGQPGTSTTATGIINNLLTQPRPGGMPGSLNGIGGTVVGGFAGVASTYRGHGVLRYNDQEEYTKWEFYYDLAQEQANAAQQQQRMMQGNQSVNPLNPNQPQPPSTGSNSSFGNNQSFGR